MQAYDPFQAFQKYPELFRQKWSTVAQMWWRGSVWRASGTHYLHHPFPSSGTLEIFNSLSGTRCVEWDRKWKSTQSGMKFLGCIFWNMFVQALSLCFPFNYAFSQPNLLLCITKKEKENSRNLFWKLLILSKVIVFMTLYISKIPEIGGTGLF